MTVRLPRVEAVLGGTVDQLTVDHLSAAVAAAAEEAADLDFKQADYAKGESEELAKDVAAMANAVGGLILVGIREQDLRAVELTPVPLAGDIAQRYRQVLAGRVTPMVRDVEIRVLPAAAGADRGFVLLAVPRSQAAPHAVWEPADARRRLSFPVRDGADTRYLHETELAEYYRRRFAGTAAQAERLTAVRRQGDARLNRVQLVWLTATLVPGLAGQVRAPDRLDRARSLMRAWAQQHPYQSREQLVPSRLVRANANRTRAGVRRAVLSVGQDKDPYHSTELHVELHDDGAGYAAVQLSGGLVGGERFHIPLWTATLECRWLVSLLVAHALDAGAGGEAQIAVELPAALVPTSGNPRGTGRPTRLVGPDDGFGPDPVDGAHELVPDLLPHPIEAEALADLSALAAGPDPVGRLAAQLAQDLVGAFGTDDTGLIDRDGRIRLRSRVHASQEYTDLYQWADRHGLLADPAAARA